MVLVLAFMDGMAKIGQFPFVPAAACLAPSSQTVGSLWRSLWLAKPAGKMDSLKKMDLTKFQLDEPL